MVKVFVNHLDKYTGKFIGQVLSESVVGAFGDDAGGDEEEEEEGGAEKAPDGAFYEVIGTLSNTKSTPPTWAKEIVQTDDRTALLSSLLACDIIVYNICEREEAIIEAAWAMQALHDSIPLFLQQKVFVCISTVLTWGRTKPLNPDEPDVSFTEEDYRKRRTHPNYKEQITAEKLLIKLGKTDKSKFLAYLVSSGIQYGGEENVFHYLFKRAWLGTEPHLPVFGDGQNSIPLIHIRDLASIIVNIADIRPKIKFIVAVDESNCTLEDIVQAVSKNLGVEKIQRLPKEDAFLLSDITQYHFDHLTVDLKMEATCAKESMRFEWRAETGMIENIKTVVGEFKNTRGLLPVRLCLLGPPAVGKTTVASQLCKHYKLHHLLMEEVVREEIERLERTAARGDPGDDDDEADDTAQQAKEYLEVLNDDKEANNGRYSTQHIIRFYKQRLASLPCQNQGFLLDGFPKTEEEARELFAAEEMEEEEEDTAVPYNEQLMPETVVSLEASNEFLKERVINLPQSKVHGTHNTEEGLLRRLKLFREQNEEDITVLNYFDEFEIHPVTINVSEDKSPMMLQTVEHLIKLIGQPRNYGPTPEEKAEVERIARERDSKRLAEESEERERNEAIERELRLQREKEWNERLTKVKHEEDELLETQSIPLRNYIMRHILPTLTEGLVEVCKVRPDDPVDYLAEYLFKHNPQID